MDRTEFEALRDVSGKYIDGDVRLTGAPRTEPILCADDIPIHNIMGVPLMLNVTFNPRASAFKCNVHARGVGPICRLEINGAEHPGAGRTHKHALRTESCPRQNLHRDVTPRPDLNGATLEEAWTSFCKMAGIEHRGSFICDGISVKVAL